MIVVVVVGSDKLFLLSLLLPLLYQLSAPWYARIVVLAGTLKKAWALIYRVHSD